MLVEGEQVIQEAKRKDGIVNKNNTTRDRSYTVYLNVEGPQVDPVEEGTDFRGHSDTGTGAIFFLIIVPLTHSLSPLLVRPLLQSVHAHAMPIPL